MIRTRSVRRAAATLVIALLTAPLAESADWSRWLGPEQNGTSPERGHFGKAVPELSVAWNRPLGIAYSAIAVSDGKAVTMFGDGETDWLTAIDAATGEELWRYRIDDMFPKIGGADGGQLSMPVVDGGIVYGLGAKGQLFAVKLGDGSELWSVRIDKAYGARQPHFGFTSTPLPVADLLIVQTGADEGRSLVALRKKTGQKVWSIGDEKVGYQSPVYLALAGKPQVVAATNDSVSGVSPDDGTILWSAEHGLVEDRDGWSTPVSIGKDRFVLNGREESAAYRVTQSGDGFGVEELWRSRALKKNFVMPAYHKGRIFGFDGDFLTCVEAKNGEQLWKSRTEAAGLVIVEGHLVLFAADGDLVVGAASPKRFKEKARIKVGDNSGFTFPSFSDGGIFVRNLERIARVDVGSTSRAYGQPLPEAAISASRDPDCAAPPLS